MTAGRGWRRRAVLVLVVATMVALSAFSCVPGGPRGAGEPPSAPPLSAWQQVLDGVGPDGEVTKDVALAAFSLVYGPVPGVAVPSGAPSPLHSGTAALRWVLNRWTELDPAQRDAVRTLADVDVPEPAPEPAVLPGAAPGATTGPTEAQIRASCRNDPVNRDRLSAWFAKLAEKVGVDVAVTLTACSSPLTPVLNGANTTADTLATHRDGKQTCRFRYFAPFTVASPPEQDEVLAHEAFHCLQNTIVDYDGMPSWVLEGLAEWASSAITGHYVMNAGWWDEYVDHPERSLLKRAYDAVGFWWELDYRGEDVWGRVVPILRAAADAAGSAADKTRAAFAVVNVPGLLDAWPASFLRDADRERAWDTAGIGLPGVRGVVPGPAVANGATTPPIAAEPFASPIVAVELNADVVTLQGTGTVRGRFGPGFTPKLDFPMAAAIGQVFCTLGSANCRCPDDSPKAGTPFVVVEGGSKIAFVAVTGGPDAAAVSLTGTSIDDFCGKAPPPVPTGVVPRDCPSASVVGDAVAASSSGPVEARFAPGRWEYEGDVLPPKYGVTCGYHRWSTATFPDGLGHMEPVMLAEVALYLFDETRPQDPAAVPAQVPGASAAWFWGGGLFAVAGGRTLGVRASALAPGDLEETSVKIAAAVLASG